jgi:gamma-glutamyltranspeptidase / glutathione hydrolase
MTGVVAAGHPIAAEAGAQVLREGGNAVDAAVCAVLTSFAVESPLTGFGAGGFMMVHSPGPPAGGAATTLIDFFVSAPGKDGAERGVELAPVVVRFDADTTQTFYVGPASCGVPGTAAGLEQALRRFGSAPLADLAAPGIRVAREGAPVNAEQGYILEILWPIHERLEETRSLYAPEGRPLREGDVFRFPELAETLERFAAEGAEPFYRGEVAAALSGFVREHGGTLGPTDLAEYEAIEREPIRVPFRGTEVLTNPPPSSGGILIAYALSQLERLGERSGPERLVEAMDAANKARNEAFAEALYGDRLPGDLLGSTTHISVLDGDGMCASVTCSNGSGSGVLVPGTGVILNNMLGEEDLNPLGFHAIAPGRRVPSMMAPTVVLRDGEIALGLGSAGSNRIRSAILQTVVRAVEEGMAAGDAVRAPRLHFEQGIVQAEPGIDEAALARIEAGGIPVLRRPRVNLFFGGVQAVARDPSSGELSGGGDPRRGGSVAVA